MGRSKTVRADGLRAHIQTLLDANTTMANIAAAAMVSETVVNKVMNGKKDAVSREGATRIMALKPGQARESILGHDATGTRRRLQAMAADGHPMKYIAAQLATSNDSRLIGIRTGRITTVGQWQRDAVKALYERLCGQQGPDEQVRRTALYVKGWLPSSAWKGVDIDDPQAAPPGCADA